ncbi:MAG TPA: HicB family toxin-antitoxin system [Aldersonia sp.]
MSKTYEVTVTREGKWWMVAVPAIDGLTQARRLADTEQMARELIALEENLALDDVAVTVHVRLVEGGEDLADRVSEIKKDRAAAERAKSRAAEATQQLAHELVEAEVPVRDIGALLELSYQRVNQLVKS